MNIKWPLRFKKVIAQEILPEESAAPVLNFELPYSYPMLNRKFEVIKAYSLSSFLKNSFPGGGIITIAIVMVIAMTLISFVQEKLITTAQSIAAIIQDIPIKIEEPKYDVLATSILVAVLIAIVMIGVSLLSHKRRQLHEELEGFVAFNAKALTEWVEEKSVGTVHLSESSLLAKQKNNPLPYVLNITEYSELSVNDSIYTLTLPESVAVEEIINPQSILQQKIDMLKTYTLSTEQNHVLERAEKDIEFINTFPSEMRTRDIENQEQQLLLKLEQEIDQLAAMLTITMKETN